MKPTYFDIHSHLDDEAYSSDREEVIARLNETNTWTTSIGTDIASSQNALKLADTHKNVFACIGIHPRDRKSAVFPKDELKQLVSHPKVVAIGECGLDYFHLDLDSDTEKKEQKDFFESQINFAVEHKKPLMIHCRDAYEDTLDMLESSAKVYGAQLFGDMHFFAGSVDHARRLLDIGFTISFTGVITFARDYDEVIQFTPLASILSETDAPYVSPVPYRGKRNEPSYVSAVVEKISVIKGESIEKVREQMVENALTLFGLGA